MAGDTPPETFLVDGSLGSAAAIRRGGCFFKPNFFRQSGSTRDVPLTAATDIGKWFPKFQNRQNDIVQRRGTFRLRNGNPFDKTFTGEHSITTIAHSVTTFARF